MAGMRSSYYPNYFSLEDIMASEERIPVEVFLKQGDVFFIQYWSYLLKVVTIVTNIGHVWQVKEDLADLGFLDPGADLKELKRGTKYSDISLSSILYQVFSMSINDRLELPQWMVEGLNTGRSPYLDVEVGEHYIHSSLFFTFLIF